MAHPYIYIYVVFFIRFYIGNLKNGLLADTLNVFYLLFMEESLRMTFLLTQHMFSKEFSGKC